MEFRHHNHSIISDRLDSNNIEVIYLNKNKGFDFNVFKALFKLFSVERPDVVHSHLYSLLYVAPVALITQIPIKIHTVHSIANKEVSQIKRKLHQFFFNVGGVLPVAISPVVRKTIFEEYNLKNKKVPIVNNGIDLSNCKPKSSFDFNEKIEIVHIGSFKEAKNHYGILDAFKKVNNEVPNTFLNLIGSGPCEKQIKEKVELLGLVDKVEFLGVQSYVYNYLNNADIFILPYLNVE